MTNKQIKAWMNELDKTLENMGIFPITSTNNKEYTKNTSEDQDQILNEVKVWKDIYKKINEDGFGDLVRGDKQITKGDIRYTQNPDFFYSVGNDQEDSDGNLRVTQNWTDGKELSELDEVKKMIEKLEREVHEAEVFDQPRMKNLLEQLKSLRKKLRSLSDAVIPPVDKDVT